MLQKAQRVQGGLSQFSRVIRDLDWGATLALAVFGQILYTHRVHDLAAVKLSTWPG